MIRIVLPDGSTFDQAAAERREKYGKRLVSKLELAVRDIWDEEGEKLRLAEFGPRHDARAFEMSNPDTGDTVAWATGGVR